MASPTAFAAAAMAANPPAGATDPSPKEGFVAGLGAREKEGAVLGVPLAAVVAAVVAVGAATDDIGCELSAAPKTPPCVQGLGFRA